MQLKDESYKGYAIKFVEKILGPNAKVTLTPTKVVQAQFKSQVTGKILGDQGTSKEAVLTKVKKMIDKEVKYKGM